MPTNSSRLGALAQPGSNKGNIAVNAAFDTLLIIGLLFLFAIFFTAYISRSIKRSVTWYALVLAMIFNNTSSLLLLGQQNGPPPSFGICVFQATLLYPAIVLMGFALLATFVQLYQDIAVSIYHRPFHRFWSIGLVIMPIAVALIILAITIVHTVKNPQFVSRQENGMFCHLSDGMNSKINAILFAVAAICVFVLQGMSWTLLYWNWSTSKVARNGLVALFIRASVFFFLTILALALSFQTIFKINGVSDAFSNLVTGALPGAAAVTFASQSDIINVWKFWTVKNKGTKLESDGSFSSSKSTQSQRHLVESFASPEA